MTNQKQSKLIKASEGALPQILKTLAAASLIALAALMLPKEKITQARLDDGKIATYIEPPLGRNSLVVNSENGRAFYFDGGTILEYTSPDEKTYRITPKGYSTFNPETGEYENFVTFSGRDSVIRCQIKKHKDIIRQIKAQKERNALEAGM